MIYKRTTLFLSMWLLFLIVWLVLITNNLTKNIYIIFVGSFSFLLMAIVSEAEHDHIRKYHNEKRGVKK